MHEQSPGWVQVCTGLAPSVPSHSALAFTSHTPSREVCRTCRMSSSWHLKLKCFPVSSSVQRLHRQAGSSLHCCRSPLTNKITHHLRGVVRCRGNSEQLLSTGNRRVVDGLDIDAVLAHQLVTDLCIFSSICNLKFKILSYKINQKTRIGKTVCPTCKV